MVSRALWRGASGAAHRDCRGGAQTAHRVVAIRAHGDPANGRRAQGGVTGSGRRRRATPRRLCTRARRARHSAGSAMTAREKVPPPRVRVETYRLRELRACAPCSDRSRVLGRRPRTPNRTRVIDGRQRAGDEHRSPARAQTAVTKGSFVERTSIAQKHWELDSDPQHRSRMPRAESGEPRAESRSPKADSRSDRRGRKSGGPLESGPLRPPQALQAPQAPQATSGTSGTSGTGEHLKHRT